ncbi:MAG: ACT domain-containing protein [Oscillospiraceae bacterium]|nr:ACT domain-containing protein [Oscillospiraceae bacterium]MBQ4544017.1 ACT domain-containing protein [Oscillospiraceae bacterium]MBQ6901859.1 ACT domain-containing protein [Oscillospiraceae bacterium]
MTARGGYFLQDNHKYYIVEDTALPDVLIRAVKAKELLSVGKSKTVNEAVAAVGISRSAFYKYKDLISPFNDMSLGHIITFSMLLQDKPGVLSGILSHFAVSGANILTIYQTIPSGGRATVTISAETKGMKTSIDSFIERAMQLDGVISFGPLAGQ